MTALLFVAGLVLLVAGAESLVRGATRLASAAGIAPLVVGLTVVAFGTSAPELAVTTAATLQGDADLALGNVVGSNILNVLLILGLSAVVAPLVVQRRVVRLEVPFMIAVTALVGLLTVDGSISRGEGAALLIGGITYTVVLVVQARKANAGSTAASSDRPATSALVGSAARVLLGLVLLVLGSRWIVQGAEAMAADLGVPNLVIGLTIVSAGTSLPELATSVVASIRGERDLAVGNIIGSNVFNLLIILAPPPPSPPEGSPSPSPP
jgi:cation:H+ antiporter